MCVDTCVCLSSPLLLGVAGEFDIDIETQVLSSDLTLELHLPQAAPQSDDDDDGDNVCATSATCVPLSNVACPMLSSSSFASFLACLLLILD